MYKLKGHQLICYAGKGFIIVMRNNPDQLIQTKLHSKSAYIDLFIPSE